MSTGALTVQSEDKGMISVAGIQQQQAMIFKLMSEAMKKGEDFGTVPGAKKPSLYKAGSEKILSMFRLSVDVLVEEITLANNLGPYDEYRVRVYVTVKEMASGRFVGKGMGERSTWEEKYKWRAATGEGEYEYYERINPELVRTKFWRGQGYKEQSERQVRVPTADRINTVLKMAKKSAQIDATLTATAASAIFTQDLEDIPGYLLNTESPETEPQQEPKPEARPKPPGIHSAAQGPVVKKTPQRKAQASAPAQQEVTEEFPRERDPKEISEKQEKMLWAVSRQCHLSDDEVKAKLRAEYKGVNGKPVEHSRNLRWQDFQAYLDSVDPDFQFHYQAR